MMLMRVSAVAVNVLLSRPVVYRMKRNSRVFTRAQIKSP